MGTSRAALVALILLAGCTAAEVPCAVGQRVDDQIVLVARWRHERPVAGEAFGANLDRRTSDGDSGDACDPADFVSPLSGIAGVDNRYASNLVPLFASTGTGSTPIGDRVAAELASGASLWALEIERLAPGTAPRVFLLSVTATGALDVAADGSLAAGATVRVVSRAELATLCLPEGDIGAIVPTFELPLGTAIGPRTVFDGRLRLVVEPDGTVTQGELGAIVTIDTIQSVFEVEAPELSEISIVTSLTGPDLHDADGACTNVSLGVGLDFVPVTLAP